MAFGAVALLGKGLGAVVAGTTELARLMVCRGDSGGSLLHLEDLRVTVVAFVAGVGMGLAVEGDFAHCTTGKFQGLARRDSQRAAHKSNDKKHGQENSYLFHEFTPFHD